ncbi:MAG: DUF4332 domain-containing protein, partial [Promethearchaeota archaeon]
MSKTRENKKISSERKAREEPQEELEPFTALGVLPDNKILRGENNSCSLSVKRFSEKKGVKRSNKKGKKSSTRTDWCLKVTLKCDLCGSTQMFELTPEKIIYFVDRDLYYYFDCPGCKEPKMQFHVSPNLSSVSIQKCENFKIKIGNDMKGISIPLNKAKRYVPKRELNGWEERLAHEREQELERVQDKTPRYWKKKYFCSKCNRFHARGRIYEEHLCYLKFFCKKKQNTSREEKKKTRKYRSDFGEKRLKKERASSHDVREGKPVRNNYFQLKDLSQINLIRCELHQKKELNQGTINARPLKDLGVPEDGELIFAPDSDSFLMLRRFYDHDPKSQKIEENKSFIRVYLYCGACKKATTRDKYITIVKKEIEEKRGTNWREHVYCDHCKEPRVQFHVAVNFSKIDWGTEIRYFCHKCKKYHYKNEGKIYGKHKIYPLKYYKKLDSNNDDFAKGAIEEGDLKETSKFIEIGLKQAEQNKEADWSEKFETINSSRKDAVPTTELVVKGDLTLVKGVGASAASKLKNAGICTIAQLASKTPAQLSRIKGFGLVSARNIVNSARECAIKLEIKRDIEKVKLIKTKQEKEIKVVLKEINVFKNNLTIKHIIVKRFVNRVLNNPAQKFRVIWSKSSLKFQELTERPGDTEELSDIPVRTHLERELNLLMVKCKPLGYILGHGDKIDIVKFCMAHERHDKIIKSYLKALDYLSLTLSLPRKEALLTLERNERIRKELIEFFSKLSCEVQDNNFNAEARKQEMCDFFKRNDVKEELDKHEFARNSIFFEDGVLNLTESCRNADHLRKYLLSVDQSFSKFLKKVDQKVKKTQAVPIPMKSNYYNFNATSEKIEEKRVIGKEILAGGIEPFMTKQEKSISESEKDEKDENIEKDIYIKEYSQESEKRKKRFSFPIRFIQYSLKAGALVLGFFLFSYFYPFMAVALVHAFLLVSSFANIAPVLQNSVGTFLILQVIVFDAWILKFSWSRNLTLKRLLLA